MQKLFFLSVLFQISTSVVFSASLSLPKQCRTQVREVLSTLTKTQRWRRESYSGVGTAAIFRTPTETIGNWLEARVYNNKLVNILEITPEKTVRYSWDLKDCAVEKHISMRHYNQERLQKEFSDNALIQKVASYKAGVIYAWSPHMPLSMAGIAPLKTVTNKLGLELILVLDPHAEKNISIEMARKFSLDEGALKKLESVDLMLRGLGFHYPAIVVFSEGKLNDFALPGVKTSSDYEKLIKRHLSSLREAK